MTDLHADELACRQALPPPPDFVPVWRPHVRAAVSAGLAAILVVSLVLLLLLAALALFVMRERAEGAAQRGAGRGETGRLADDGGLDLHACHDVAGRARAHRELLAIAHSVGGSGVGSFVIARARALAWQPGAELHAVALAARTGSFIRQFEASDAILGPRAEEYRDLFLIAVADFKARVKARWPNDAVLAVLSESLLQDESGGWLEHSRVRWRQPDWFVPGTFGIWSGSLLIAHKLRAAAVQSPQLHQIDPLIEPVGGRDLQFEPASQFSACSCCGFDPRVIGGLFPLILRSRQPVLQAGEYCRGQSNHNRSNRDVVTTSHGCGAGVVTTSESLA